MAATCSYAQSLHAENPKDESPVKLANHFCKLARRRINERFHALKSNDDRQSNVVAKDVLNDEYRWLEEGILKCGYPEEEKKAHH